jgi:hypothetical protein
VQEKKAASAAFFIATSLRLHAQQARRTPPHQAEPYGSHLDNSRNWDKFRAPLAKKLTHL